MALGYIAGKTGSFNVGNAGVLSKMVLDYALPAALFISIVKADRGMLVADIKLTVIATVVLLAMFLIVFGVFRLLFRDSVEDAAVSALISGSPAIGFLGFAVLEPIFGISPAVGLAVAVISIEVNVISLPIGLALLSMGKAQSGGEKTVSDVEPNYVWKHIIDAVKQPVAWMPMLAVALVIAGIQWPAWLSPSFELLKSANASVAVFAVGITLSSVKIGIDIQVLAGVVLKLIVMPMVMLICGIVFNLEPTALKMLVVCSTLPPAFTGIIIGSRNNTYVATGASSLFLSVICFMFMCPVWVFITEMCINTF